MPGKKTPSSKKKKRSQFQSLGFFFLFLENKDVCMPFVCGRQFSFIGCTFPLSVSQRCCQVIHRTMKVYYYHIRIVYANNFVYICTNGTKLWEIQVALCAIRDREL